MANKQVFNMGARVPAADTTNEAGGRAYRLANKAALAQMALTGTFNQTFYATAEHQLDEIILFAKTVPPQFLAKLAVYAREKGFMKDAPSVLLAVLSMQDTQLFRKVFHRVVDNGKMLRNYVQVIRSGAVGRKSLGEAGMACIQTWFDDRGGDLIFNQSIGTDPSMSDVIRLAHVKAGNTEGRQELFKYLLGYPEDKYEVENLPWNVRALENFKRQGGDIPNVPHELLTSLPLTKNQWRDIGLRMSWTALRMNLNTLQRHGVFEDEKVVDRLANKLTDAESIRRAKAFPYQLMAAYLNADNIPRKLTNALQGALEIAVENVPAMPDGKLVLAVDVSGSMTDPITGRRVGATSKVRCVDVAGLVAAAYLRKNDECVVLPFNDRVIQLDLNPRDSVITNAQKIAARLSGGTNCAAPLEWLNEHGSPSKNVLMVSDNQSWIDTGRTTNTFSKVRGTRVMEEWQKFSRKNKGAKLVCLDIAPNTTSQAKDQSDILNIGGFSDQVFSVSASFFQNELIGDSLVNLVEALNIE